MTEWDVLESGLVQLMNSKAGVKHVVSYEQGLSMPNAKAYTTEELFAKFYQNANDMEAIGIVELPISNAAIGQSQQPYNEEGLKSIFVKTLTGETSRFQLNDGATVAELKRKVEASEGIPASEQRLIFAGKQLEDNQRVFSVLAPKSTAHLVLRLYGGEMPTYYVDKPLFDPEWNYDFRGITTDSQAYSRGGSVYRRPLGAMRYALKVLGKYADGDGWLGSASRGCESLPGEWVVAYHGTAEINVKSIVEHGFLLSKGVRFAFGHGIYCTPDPKTALDYALTYNYKGKNYRVVLQSRVDPAKLKVIAARDTPDGHSEYWIVPESGIRPYGACVFPH